MQLLNILGENNMGEFTELDDSVKNCDYKTKLAVTAWVMEKILEHAKEGGSFRYLIYDRLGFDLDAYVPLYYAGGMDISNEFDISKNEFDISKNEEILKIVKENKIEALKGILRLCDEPGCFDVGSCGTPTKEKYRLTCHKHIPTKDNT